jgi:putative peptide zinc metalloprotease protein
MKTSPSHYVFNEAVQVTPANDSTSIPMVMCELPAGEAQSIRFVAPEDLMNVLRLFDGTRSVAEVSAAYAGRNPTNYTADALERLISTFCLPKRVLLDPSRPDSPPAVEPAPKGYLSLRLRVLPNRLVRPVARWLGPLFSTPAAMVLCFVVIIAHLKFYFASSPLPTLVLAGGKELTAAMLLSIVAAVCHELGHATAFTRYGGRGTEIGLGLYLYMPVLYTDVSEAWRFSRFQRVVVDLGGIYFQAIFATIAIAAFLSTHAVVWCYTVFLVTLSLSFSLNPFLRMDGYWFVADAFGIRNLRFHSSLLLKYSLQRLLGKVNAVPGAVSRLTRKTKYFLGAYTLLSTIFFAVVIARVAHQAMFVLLPEYPNLVITISKRIAGNPTDILGVCSGIVEIFWKTMILMGCGLFGWQVIRNVYFYMFRPHHFGMNSSD